MGVKLPELDDDDIELSDHYNELVTIFFAVVVAMSVDEYTDILFSDQLSVKTLALFGVYLSVLLSWIGYHYLIVKYPYRGKSLAGKLHLFNDIAIVFMYAYLLVTVQWIAEPIDEIPHLFGFDVPGYVFYIYVYMLIFILYLVNDFVMFHEHSDFMLDHIPETLLAFVSYVVLLVIYWDPVGVISRLLVTAGISKTVVAIVGATGIMVVWRIVIGTLGTYENRS